MNVNVLSLYQKFSKYPLGRQAFSALFCMKAPYFLTIRPTITSLQKGSATVQMSQRWAVQNHIQTVHAIAVCNLVEMCMGCVAESTIPSNLRWLPKVFDVPSFEHRLFQILPFILNFFIY